MVHCAMIANEILRIAREIGYPGYYQSLWWRWRTRNACGTYEADSVNAIAFNRAKLRRHFGNDNVYMEKYLENPRHIEIQVLG